MCLGETLSLSGSVERVVLADCANDRVRALGETDLNPVSGLGKISQLLFAWIQPGNVVANIIAGGVAEAGAQQYVPLLVASPLDPCVRAPSGTREDLSTLMYANLTSDSFCRAGDLMQDLKTGHIIRASPRAQFYGQLIGSCLSIVVTTTAYTLYQSAYEIPGPSFPAPTAYVWLGLARLLRESVHSIAAI